MPAKKKSARRRPSGKAAVRSPPARSAEKRGRGRPSTFSQALADRLCALLAEGKTLREACRIVDPEGKTAKESTVRGWALDEAHPFFRAYARARQIGVYAMVDENVLIADDAQQDWSERINQKGEKYIAFDRDNVRRSALRVDSRKWIMSKLLPAFSDKLAVEGSPDKPLTVIHDVADTFISRIAGIAARLGPSPPDQRAK